MEASDAVNLADVCSDAKESHWSYFLTSYLLLFCYFNSLFGYSCKVLLLVSVIYSYTSWRLSSSVDYNVTQIEAF